MRALKLAARAPPRVNPLHDITGSDTLKMPFVASLRYMAAQYRNRRPHPIGIHGRVLSEQTAAHCWNRRPNSSEYARCKYAAVHGRPVDGAYVVASIVVVEVARLTDDLHCTHALPTTNLPEPGRCIPGSRGRRSLAHTPQAKAASSAHMMTATRFTPYPSPPSELAHCDSPLASRILPKARRVTQAHRSSSTTIDISPERLGTDVETGATRGRCFPGYWRLM